MEKIEIYIKITLAILLIFCLLDMPYGYYQFIRLGGTFAFLLLAYNSKSKPIFMVIWILFALLLNPFFKIYFSRFIWNIIDVILAIILIVSIFINTNNKLESKNGN